MSARPNNNPRFDQAEFLQPQAAGPTCSFCGQPISGHYFAVGAKPACPTCIDRARASIGGGSKLGRLARALAFGTLAGLAGALLYFVVAVVTGFEIALIAIVVGWAVGTAVHRGSRRRGGWFYQLLAVALSYAAIAGGMVTWHLATHPEERAQFLERLGGADPAAESGPEDSGADAAAAPSSAPSSADPAAVTGGAATDSRHPGKRDSRPTDAQSDPATQAAAGSANARTRWEALGPGQKLLAVAVTAAFLAVFVLSLPISAGYASPLTILIIGFGMFEAWRRNRRIPLPISGPFQVRSGPPGTPEGRQPEPRSHG